MEDLIITIGGQSFQKIQEYPDKGLIEKATNFESTIDK